MGNYMGLKSNQTYYMYNASAGPQTYEQLHHSQLYGKAISAKNTAVNNISRQSAHVNAVIDFISSVAANERKKELDSIKNYCEKMKKDYPFAANILKEDYIQSDPDGFQSELVIAFDSARKDLETTKKSIQRLYANAGLSNNGKIKSKQDYFDTEYLFTLASNLEDFAKQMVSTSVSTKIDDSSIRQKVNAFAMQGIQKLGIIDKITSGEQLIAVGAMMEVQLQQQVQQELDNSSASTFKEITVPTLDSIGEKFLNELETRQSSDPLLQLLIDNFDDPQFQLAVDNVISILGLKEDPSKDIVGMTDQLKDYINKINTEDCNAVESSFISLRQDIMKNSELNESLFKVTFKVSGSSGTKHGNIWEMIQGMLKGAKVKENVATDLVTYHFDYDVKQDSAKITNYISKLGESLSSIKSQLKKSQKNDKREALMRTVHKANISIQKINQAIEDELNKIDKFKNQKMFIQHESLKFSTSAERGMNINGKIGFSGRHMKLTSYLGYLSSMALAMKNDSNLSLNMPELEFLSYNILPGSIGDDGTTQTALENYLSMYAGMMMFDDVENMATEAIQNVQSLTSGQQVETLHVYNVNNMMVPASVILTRMSQSLQRAASTIDTGAAIQAKISIGEGKSINDVSVSIVFMQDFIDVIKSLYNAIE